MTDAKPAAAPPHVLPPPTPTAEPDSASRSAGETAAPTPPAARDVGKAGPPAPTAANTAAAVGAEQRVQSAGAAAIVAVAVAVAVPPPTSTAAIGPNASAGMDAPDAPDAPSAGADRAGGATQPVVPSAPAKRPAVVPAQTYPPVRESRSPITVSDDEADHTGAAAAGVRGRTEPKRAAIGGGKLTEPDATTRGGTNPSRDGSDDAIESGSDPAVSEAHEPAKPSSETPQRSSPTAVEALVKALTVVGITEAVVKELVAKIRARAGSAATEKLRLLKMECQSNRSLVDQLNGAAADLDDIAAKCATDDLKSLATEELTKQREKEREENKRERDTTHVQDTLRRVQQISKGNEPVPSEAVKDIDLATPSLPSQKEAEAEPSQEQLLVDEIHSDDRSTVPPTPSSSPGPTAFDQTHQKSNPPRDVATPPAGSVPSTAPTAVPEPASIRAAHAAVAAAAAVPLLSTATVIPPSGNGPNAIAAAESVAARIAEGQPKATPSQPLPGFVARAAAETVPLPRANSPSTIDLTADSVAKAPGQIAQTAAEQNTIPKPGALPAQSTTNVAALIPAQSSGGNSGGSEVRARASPYHKKQGGGQFLAKSDKPVAVSGKHYTDHEAAPPVEIVDRIDSPEHDHDGGSDGGSEENGGRLAQPESAGPPSRATLAPAKPLRAPPPFVAPLQTTPPPSTAPPNKSTPRAATKLNSEFRPTPGTKEFVAEVKDVMKHRSGQFTLKQIASRAVGSTVLAPPLTSTPANEPWELRDCARFSTMVVTHFSDRRTVALYEVEAKDLLAAEIIRYYAARGKAPRVMAGGVSVILFPVHATGLNSNGQDGVPRQTVETNFGVPLPPAANAFAIAVNTAPSASQSHAQQLLSNPLPPLTPLPASTQLLPQPPPSEAPTPNPPQPPPVPQPPVPPPPVPPHAPAPYPYPPPPYAYGYPPYAWPPPHPPYGGQLPQAPPLPPQYFSSHAPPAWPPNMSAYGTGKPDTEGVPRAPLAAAPVPANSDGRSTEVGSAAKAPAVAKAVDTAGHSSPTGKASRRARSPSAESVDERSQPQRKKHKADPDAPAEGGSRSTARTREASPGRDSDRETNPRRVASKPRRPAPRATGAEQTRERHRRSPSPVSSRAEGKAHDSRRASDKPRRRKSRSRSHSRSGSPSAEPQRTRRSGGSGRSDRTARTAANRSGGGVDAADPTDRETTKRRRSSHTPDASAAEGQSKRSHASRATESAAGAADVDAGNGKTSHSRHSQSRDSQSHAQSKSTSASHSNASRASRPSAHAPAYAGDSKSQSKPNASADRDGRDCDEQRRSSVAKRTPRASDTKRDRS